MARTCKRHLVGIYLLKLYIFQFDHAAAVSGGVFPVRHHQNGDAVFPVQLAQKLQDFFPVLTVQISDRFVCEYHLRTVTLYSETPFSSISLENKLWACYLHACIKFVEGSVLTNGSLHERFGLKESSAGSISRFITVILLTSLLRNLLCSYEIITTAFCCTGNMQSVLRLYHMHYNQLSC